jgi:acyl carrier protein
MTQTEALAWIAQVFEMAPDQLTPDTHRDNVPAWDSLGVLTLMASLDSDFGIVLTDEDIQAVKTVADILHVMRRHGTLTQAAS